MMLLPPRIITVADAVGTPGPVRKVADPRALRSLTIQTSFTYGSGGTTLDVYIQTSLDQGVVWIDVANFHYLAAGGVSVITLSSLTPVVEFVPTNGTLANDTVRDGVFGSWWRVLTKSSGTYAGGSTVRVDVNSQLLR